MGVQRCPACGQPPPFEDSAAIARRERWVERLMLALFLFMLVSERALVYFPVMQAIPFALWWAFRRSRKAHEAEAARG